MIKIIVPADGSFEIYDARHTKFVMEICTASGMGALIIANKPANRNFHRHKFLHAFKADFNTKRYAFTYRAKENNTQKLFNLYL